MVAGGSGPAVASTTQPLPERPNTVTPSRLNVEVSVSAIWGSGSGSRSTTAAIAVRACASARAWWASWRRRAAVSTRVLTTAATVRNVASVSRSRPLLMVNVWNGGAKNQLSARNAATAVSMAGTVPPMVATPSTNSR